MSDEYDEQAAKLVPDVDFLGGGFPGAGNFFVRDIRRKDVAQALRTLAAERDILRDEVLRWRKSFAGHLYITNEDYSALVSERDNWRKAYMEIAKS